MSGIEFSIISETPEPPAPLLTVLEEFEAQHGIHVQVRVLNWDVAWSEITRYAVQGAGPDISEIGTTWIHSLNAMHTIRPFSEREVVSLGGPAAFVVWSWKTEPLAASLRTLAVPWLADTRLIYYRRDLLRQAGIDEQTAFQTAAQLANTLERLQAGGVDVPWAMPTAEEQTIVHILASWVWGAGGNFMTPDGRHASFLEPAAMAGITAYFGLHRYLAPQARNLDDNQANILFRQGGAAAIITGPWLLNAVRRARDAAPEVIENLGMAAVPGVPFVGGTDLVIWNHTRQADEAVQLARFLTSQKVQMAYTDAMGLLPARLDCLNMPPFTTDVHYRVIARSLRTGRGFRATYMWGAVENRLTAALHEIWSAIFASPETDLEHLVIRRLTDLAEELERILA